MKRLCDVLGVSRSGYYAWLIREPSAHDQHDDVLKDAIEELHQGPKRCYGAIRLHKSLRTDGLSCSRRRINRLMREMQIKASTTGLYAWRPGHHAFYTASDNQLKEAGNPTGVGQQWGGDFTYVKTQSGWLYHAVVLDLFSRRVIGWSFSRKRNTELTMSALRMALSREQPRPGCIFHSDQGIEYAAHDYRRLVESASLTRSMSRKATPQDNARVESYFGTMKAELIHGEPLNDPVEATAKIIEYIEFYNEARLHSSIGYLSPVEFEKQCA